MPPQKIYSIPVEDKYIIYAPLKRIAFLGNKALKNAIDQIEFKGINEKDKNNETIKALNNIGFFNPDNLKLPSIDNKQAFSPSLCILMPTTACNLACSYCYADNPDKKPLVMKWAIAKQGIDIAYQNSKENNSKKFSLSFHGGGEPTLPQNLVLKACNYARKLDPQCPISITSNCVWEDDFRNKLLEYVTEVSISFDGAKITQDRQRPDKEGKGTFNRVMKSIQEIEGRNIAYGIRMTITKQSLPELLSNVTFIAKRTKCHVVHVEAVYDKGRAMGSDLKLLDVDLFVEKFLEAYDFAKSKGLEVKVSSVRPNVISNSFCKATSEALIVTTHGELTSCYEVFDDSHPLSKDFLIGTVDSQIGIQLYADKRTQLLQMIEDNKASCRTCFCYYHCAGDCPPKSLYVKSKKDSFRCRITQELTKAMIIDKIIEGDGIWIGNSSIDLSIIPI